MAIKRTRESEEMYLETILLLHKGQPNVRAVDVRDELGLAKSSVSRGVNLLEKQTPGIDAPIPGVFLPFYCRFRCLRSMPCVRKKKPAQNASAPTHAQPSTVQSACNTVIVLTAALADP